MHTYSICQCREKLSCNWRTRKRKRMSPLENESTLPGPPSCRNLRQSSCDVVHILTKNAFVKKKCILRGVLSVSTKHNHTRTHQIKYFCLQKCTQLGLNLCLNLVNKSLLAQNNASQLINKCTAATNFMVHSKCLCMHCFKTGLVIEIHGKM